MCLRSSSGGGVGDGWFHDNVTKMVGNGRDTFFWTDPWVGGIALSVQFSRLYDLSINKNRKVEEMFEKGWGERGDAWECRRRLWDWEEMLVEECRLLLANVVLQVNSTDHWRWSRDLSEVTLSDQLMICSLQMGVIWLPRLLI